MGRKQWAIIVMCLLGVNIVQVQVLGKEKVPVVISNNNNIMFLAENRIVCESYEEENLLWAKNGDVLYTSKDEGETFTETYIFKEPHIDSVKFINKQVLLVTASNGRFSKDANARVYRSLDLGATFEEVLQIASGSAYNWNIVGDKEGSIYLSEYGYKQLPNNARRIYKSEDSGKTWRVIYDNGEHDNNHMHRIHIDKNNSQIIYQSIGDGTNNRLIRSQDGGKTWKTLKTEFNPTAVVQIQDHLLWGTDTHPRNGIYKMNKKGKIISSFHPPQPYGGSIYDMVEIDGIIYAGFLSYGWASQTWNGSLWRSKDEGTTWELYVEFPKETGEGIGLYKMIALKGDLYIDVSMGAREKETNQKTTYTGTLKIEIRE